MTGSVLCFSRLALATEKLSIRYVGVYLEDGTHGAGRG